MNPETHSPSQAQNKKIREQILKIVQRLYYIHLFLSLIAAIVLIILQPRLRQKFTLTFALVIGYGFMLVWLSIMNIIFVLIKKQGCAVWCNRVVAKMFIIIFPVLALIAYMNEHFLNIFWVKVFLIYWCVLSFVLLAYEVYSCTCGHHQEPSYVYEHNDLDGHSNQVWKVRKDFFNNIKNNNPLSQ